MTSTVLDVLSYAWNELGGKALGLAALAYVWHHIAGAKADRIADIAKQVAKVGFAIARTQLSNDPHFDPYHFEQLALERCKAQLDKLGVPFEGEILGLVKHELDVLLADLALDHLQGQMDEVSDRADDVVESMVRAKAQGLAHPLLDPGQVEVEVIPPTSIQTGPDASGSTVAAGEPSQPLPAPAATAAPSTGAP
jgi:hypothetical protein